MKKKEIETQFQINEPVFRSSLYIFVGGSFDEMIKVLKDRWPDFALDNKFKNSSGLTFVHEADFLYHFIWLKKYDGSIESQGVLTHELLHFVMDTMKTKNMLLDEVSANEPACYLLEYYFTECLKKL